MPDAAPWMQAPTMRDAACQPEQSNGLSQWYQPLQTFGISHAVQDVHGVVQQGSLRGSVPNSGSIAENSEYAQNIAPTMRDAACQQQQSNRWLQWYQPQDTGIFHAVQYVHGVVQQGSLGGSVPNNGLIAENSEYAQGSGAPEHAQHQTNGELVVDNQQHECGVGPSTTRSEAWKDPRYWTEAETSVLVECKRLAFHDKASPFRKQSKSNVIKWDAVSQHIKNHPLTRGSEKTWRQCQLRWDTLVKSHRIIKERCMKTKKVYAELTEDEKRHLRLATILKSEWYEVIDTVCGNARSHKRGNLSPRVGDFSQLKKGRTEIGAVPVSPHITPTGPGSQLQFAEGDLPGSTRSSPAGSPATSWKQVAIPGFWSLDRQLRSTLLDLILGRHLLKGASDGEGEGVSYSCRWLSIVQNRSCSDIYNDVSMLVMEKLVHFFLPDYDGVSTVDWSRFCVFDKFVKKVIQNNPAFDTHRHFKNLDVEKKVMSAREFWAQQQTRALLLDGCEGLEKVDLRGLPKLRLLVIRDCPVLKEVTGWKYLPELGWLEIFRCKSYSDYPDLRNLPSLREFRVRQSFVPDCGPRHDFDISQCVRLRRLDIWSDRLLEESGDLSSLNCLESLNFSYCSALSTIAGLSGLHSLTILQLSGCKALCSLPDMGHMKVLVCINIRDTGVEEIPGIENLVSLKTLDCSYSKLKRLPDLHHLRALQEVCLYGTPLIEDDPSSFYFANPQVLFNCEETRPDVVEVSDISDTEYHLSDSWDDEY